LAGAETVEHFHQTLEGLKRHVFPRRAAQIQKRYMRRFLRKAAGVKVREFMARFAELNEYLTRFPPQQNGGPSITPLDDDEQKDIAEFAVPHTWQKGMVQHGFDPSTFTLTELIEFCERFEYTEDSEWTSGGQKAKTSQNGGKTESKSQVKSSAGGGKSSDRGPHNNKSSDGGASNNHKRKYNANAYCKFHGVYGHSTDDCTVVQQQISRMQGAYEANKRAFHGDKTWTRNHNTNATKSALTPQKKSQEQLHALMEERIEKEVEARIKKRSEEALYAFENMSLSDDEEAESKKKKE
jgi:hypothetical protein